MSADPFVEQVTDKIAVKCDEAARLTSVSPATITQASNTTNPEAWPPPLRAKRNNKGHRYYLVRDLRAWVESWPDA